ncbi:Hypothetical predicted protein [Paramuricea clavata]|uniref:Uncharacterized protein n=1 Tax=Paramuricea clavata TaxID=317549 RepID=A0A6S7KLE9_PARCT|nr:Hypothetical predicted protein [Paramuricea clavata]
MTEITDPNVLDQLENFGKATCLIRVPGQLKGTGFHFGSGWVMSVAHNFQNATDTPQLHSLLSRATFTFTVNGEHYNFGAQENRMAFIHHLQLGPGNQVDPINMDIAMVKLGIQYQQGRTKESDYEAWETGEQRKLNSMNLICFADIEERQVIAGNQVYAIHYGGDDDNMKKEQHTIVAVTNTWAGDTISVIPVIKLQRPIQAGASGCPILSNDFKLVGLGFCANNANGFALPWNDGNHSIKQYISDGVEIIAQFERYLALKDIQAQVQAGELRQTLLQKAEQLDLTIYLMNGVILNGPN